MAQFNHKRITNPTITCANKIMEAIAECAKAIKEMGNSSRNNKINQLEQLATQAVAHDTRVAAKFLSALSGVCDAQQRQNSKATNPEQTTAPTKQQKKVQGVGHARISKGAQAGSSEGARASIFEGGEASCDNIHQQKGKTTQKTMGSSQDDGRPQHTCTETKDCQQNSDQCNSRIKGEKRDYE